MSGEGVFAIGRRKMPSLLLIAGAIATVFVFVFLRGEQRHESGQVFLRLADQRLASIERAFAAQLDHLKGLRAFLTVSPDLKRQEFRDFVRANDRLPAVQAVEWIPRIAAQDLDDAVARARADGLTEFQIFQKEPGGARPVSGRDAYFPVYFVEPLAGNEKALGFDLGSNPARRAALERARDTGKLVATEKIVLVQDTEKLESFLVFAPVYTAPRSGGAPLDAETGGDGLSLAERRARLSGFALGVFRIRDVVEAALARVADGQGTPSAEFSLAVFDQSAEPAAPLYIGASGSEDGETAVPADRLPEWTEGLHLARAFDIGGRSWTAVMRPTSAALQAPLAPAAVPAAMVFAIFVLLSFLFRAAVDREKAIAAVVDKQTGELRRAHDGLSQFQDITSRSGMEFAERIERVLALGCAIFEMPRALVSRIEGDHAVLEHVIAGGTKFTPGWRCPLRETYCAVTAERKGVVAFADASKEADVEEIDDPEFETSAYFGAPLRVGGKFYGTLSFSSPTPRERPVDQSEENFIQVLAQWIGKEMERYDALEALRIGESRLSEVVETVMDGIITIDARGHVGTFNKAAEDIFGYDKSEVVGENVAMLMGPEQAVHHDRYISDYLETGTAKIIGRSRELEGRRSDGSLFPLELAVSELPGQQGAGFVGVIRDITERKKVDRLKNEFVSTVSHELRTPMTSIMASLRMLSAGAVNELPPKAVELIDIAYTNSDRLVRLINDILDVEKIEAGLMEFRMMPRDIVAIVHEAVAANQGYAERLGAVLEVKAPDEELLVRGDADRLNQVLTNLISNGCKFCPEGGAVEIHVAKTDDNFLRLSVVDHGPGIPEEFRDSVFERFAQADGSDARAKGGSGLGLNITKSIVERHGGSIFFETETGEGTSFHIDLPRWHAPDDAFTTVSDGERPLVLICEDDHDAAAMFARILNMGGFDTDITWSAEEALIRLEQRDYAAMTLDLSLPGLDGLGMIQQLRKRAKTADLPVIVVSALAEDGKRLSNGEAINVLDWLDKPVDETRLIDGIQRAVSMGPDKPTVLHVEDDLDLVTLVKRMVGDDVRVLHAPSLSYAKEFIEAEAKNIDLVLLDLKLPDGSGEDLLPLLHDDAGAAIPVIVFAGGRASEAVSRRVHATLVKARTPEGKLVETIRAAITRNRSLAGPEAGEGAE